MYFGFDVLFFVVWVVFDVEYMFGFCMGNGRLYEDGGGCEFVVIFGVGYGF